MVERNSRLGRHGEIDLIVRRANVIVFVEVKFRRTSDFGAPASAVGPNKQRRLRRLAALWLASNHVTTRSVRFDVVSVVNDDVEVIEGAF